MVEEDDRIRGEDDILGEVILAVILVVLLFPPAFGLRPRPFCEYGQALERYGLGNPLPWPM